MSDSEPELVDYRCPRCPHLRFDSRRAFNHHLGQSVACQIRYEDNYRKRRWEKRKREGSPVCDDEVADWEIPVDPVELQATIDEYREGRGGGEDEPPQSTDAPPSKRARVEEVPDEDYDELHTKPYPGRAGETFGRAQTIFDKLRERQSKGDLGEFGPFADRDELELASWLITESGASQSAIDKFLKLNIVCSSFVLPTEENSLVGVDAHQNYTLIPR